MARRRRVSSRNEAGTVSFFASGKGITVAKRKSVVFVGKSPGKRKKITFTARGSGTKKRTVSFYAPSLKVLRKRALLKREIVKEVVTIYMARLAKAEQIIYKNEGEIWTKLKDEAKRTALLAIEMWEKRR